MQEPTLEQIGDYDALKGEKRFFVTMVLVSGLFIGALYTIVAHSYVGQVHDELPVHDGISVLPFDR